MLKHRANVLTIFYPRVVFSSGFGRMTGNSVPLLLMAPKAAPKGLGALFLLLSFLIF
tara:strand:- start:455 stop:625 length:171 start_codon:yes stop_codon:yes gene_type:complete